jgi:hypothetical protein
MSPRRLFTVLFFALALLLGQQAAAQHDLKHAGEQRHLCDQCFLAAQVSGGLATHVAAPPPVLAGHVDALPDAHVVHRPAIRLSYRSRAPPAFL